ncbi:L,D-transpeptidase [Taklimakanibacter lacteus]|uniref:L,D-transpeptidase n=1 Tax=Taklimakanibacter lacteus TaxID=2268456 RepID=UPI000E670B10
MPITRRFFLLGGAGLALSACVRDGSEEGIMAEPTSSGPSPFARNYGALPDEPFPIPAADLKKLKPKYRRRIVDFPTAEIPGTIIVDTPNRFLYLVMENGTAMRYGVGIGRDGFSWGGRGRIQYKRAWPRWTPPSEMIARQPELEKYRNGMEPALDNPLGARAMYIFQDGQDTLYRLHGTQDAASIGKAVSSGCVRLINQDVIDLFNRVRPGAAIIVRQHEDEAV